MADREQPVTLRTRKFIRNALLGRKQMVVYVTLSYFYQDSYQILPLTAML